MQSAVFQFKLSQVGGDTGDGRAESCKGANVRGACCGSRAGEDVREAVGSAQKEGERRRWKDRRAGVVSEERHQFRREGCTEASHVVHEVAKQVQIHRQSDVCLGASCASSVLLLPALGTSSVLPFHRALRLTTDEDADTSVECPLVCAAELLVWECEWLWKWPTAPSSSPPSTGKSTLERP